MNPDVDQPGNALVLTDTPEGELVASPAKGTRSSWPAVRSTKGTELLLSAVTSCPSLTAVLDWVEGESGDAPEDGNGELGEALASGEEDEELGGLDAAGDDEEVGELGVPDEEVGELGESEDGAGELGILSVAGVDVGVVLPSLPVAELPSSSEAGGVPSPPFAPAPFAP
jgi:hypothetical protein